MISLNPILLTTTPNNNKRSSSSPCPPFSVYVCIRVVMVLLTTVQSDMWLVNCTTLPVSPLALCKHHCMMSIYGFGYDCLSDDYKFVKISQCHSHKAIGGISCAGNLVDIYSLKMRSWKRVGICPHDLHCNSEDSSCLFFNGAIHRLGRCKSSDKEESVVIVAFDLSSEKFKFKEIPAPPACVDNAKLVVVDGCLGMVLNPSSHQDTEIWFMKSYPSVGSWTCLVLEYEALCFHQDKILVRDRCDEDLKWYCLKDGEVEVCFVCEGEHSLREGITYSESLALFHPISGNVMISGLAKAGNVLGANWILEEFKAGGGVVDSRRISLA